MPSFAGKPSSFYSTTGGVPVEGAWYSGRRYLGGQLLAPGEHQPGQRVSAEVIAQTNPANVSFIESQIKAHNIQAPTQINLPSSGAVTGVVNGLQSSVDTAKSNLRDTLGAEKAVIDEKMKALREKEQVALKEIGTLTQPFREELEKTERERLFINENFEANQKLVTELDQLLTEGNELIKQQSEVTGLSAIRNPRIQKTMNDVAARTGVIEAVINARNGQIGQAQNMIDRTVRAINDDRADQISYYETILDLSNRDIILLDADAKTNANEQLSILKNELILAQETKDYVQKLMLNPDTAGILGDAGVTLNDSVETINRKVAQAVYAREVADLSNVMAVEGGQVVVDPGSVPASELRTLTDSRGNKHYYQVKDKARVGTAGERAVAGAATQISNSTMTFSDVVVSFASELDLSEIYQAYNQSDLGQRFGRPIESSNEIAYLYQWARGEISEAEYRALMGQ